VQSRAQAAPLEIEQHLTPALRAFAKTVSHGQQFFAAILIGTHDHHNTLFFFSHLRFEVDPVGPDVEKPPVAKVAFLPGLIVLPPISLKSRDSLCG
jgi:hypothetical protein